MKKDMMVYVKDILDSILLIESYIKSLTLSKFIKSDLTQDAVMRRLMVIGEAAARFTPEFKRKYKIIPWKQVVGLRNILIHNYEGVMLNVVWKIITKNLPKTKKKLLKISETMKAIK